MKQFFTLIATICTLTVFAQTVVVDFEDFTLETESMMNNSGDAGGFYAGDVFLPNTYNEMWGSWGGWAISNRTDTTTEGYTNDGSAIAGAGYDGSANFAVTFASEGRSTLSLAGNALGKIVEGFHVTNNTYAYLSMLNGDAFAKKFGGETGDDPDYLLLTVKKYYNGELSADSVNFYLADYRFEDNSQDYIVEDWSFVDLSSLGEVDSLQFTMSSTDNGAFGMNTPAYFCVDNLTIDYTISSTTDVFSIETEIYPNPVQNAIYVNGDMTGAFDYTITDMTGNMIAKGRSFAQSAINVQNLPKGMYVLSIRNEEGQDRELFMKE